MNNSIVCQLKEKGNRMCGEAVVCVTAETKLGEMPLEGVSFDLFNNVKSESPVLISQPRGT